jgi:hypothetical protein
LESDVATYEEYGPGYPSDAELEVLKTFQGTPREFLEFMGSIWRNGAGWSLEEVPHDSRPNTTEHKAAFITGGWSGCEEVQSVVEGTVFSTFFYSAWRRGGYHEYRVSGDQIDSKGFFGEFGRWQDEQSHAN